MNWKMTKFRREDTADTALGEEEVKGRNEQRYYSEII
jgi:hypothetical protein